MASSVIGALRVNLGLDSAQFSRGATGVQKKLRGMRADFLAVAKIGASVGVGLVALGGAALQSAREIDRLAQVSNATPEAFQRWSAATQTVGIEQEKLADILKDTNDRIGDFVTTGGGPMADFFENIAPKVGVTAEQFARLSGPEALQLYVSSLEKAGASQQEMTFYMEALASDATLLLPLLRDNGAEMARLGDRAAAMGGVLDNETVAALSRTRTAFGEIMTAMTGARNVIAAEMAPALERLAVALSASLQPGGQLRAVMEAMGQWAAAAVRAIASLTVALGVRYVAALGLAATATGTLTGALTVLRGALMRTGFGVAAVLAGELAFRLSGLRDGLGETEQASYDAEAGTAALNAALGTFRSTAAPQAAASAIDIANANIQLAESALQAAEAEVAKRRALAEITGDGRMGRGRDTELDAALGDLDKAQAAIDKARSDQARAVRTVAGSMSEVMAQDAEAARELAVTVNATTNAVGGLGAAGRDLDLTPPLENADFAAEQMSSTLASATSSAVIGAKNAKDAFSRLASQLSQMAANAAIQGLFANIFGGASGGIMGTIFGAASPAPSFDGGGWTGSGPRTGGLDGKGGFMAMLHPQETVTDYSGGAARGGGEVLVRVMVNEGPMFASDVQTMATGTAVRVVQEYDRRAAPGTVQRTLADPRRRG